MDCTDCHVEQNVKEIRIPLTYGYTAAREWGMPGGEHCLALHGWQDNAGSFDMLIPFLSSNLHIIAIDIIGHGLSSHKPVGAPYFYLEFVYQVKCIVQHLNWNTFTIIGHSMGSSIGLVFASLFPNMVDKLVCIDLMKPITYPTGNILSLLRSSFKAFENDERKTLDTQPTYSEDEILNRFITGRDGALSEHSAQILSKRGTKKLENGRCVFSRDIRIKNIWASGLSCFDTMKEVILGIRCDLLIIKAKDSPTYSDDISINFFLDVYKRQCNKFEMVEVDGNHFVHLDHPESVAPFINKFISQKPSSL